jgi:hypothetical protein
MATSSALSLVQRHDRRLDILAAIRVEFERWPRLALTHAQACRLWSLDTTTCRDLLDGLVDDGVLGTRADGTYVVRASAFPARLAS